jgi:hypothetical protein
MTPIRRTFLIGLAAFLLFAVFVTNWSPAAPATLERRLQDAVDVALNDRSFNWARVTVDGQVATLRGRWPDEGVHEAAIEAIYSAEWAGGRLAGGITRVIDESVPQEGEAPSQLIAVLQDGTLELSGIAPSEVARDDISGLASVLFPARSSIRMSVRDNASDAAGWSEAASQLLSALSRLDQSAGRMNGDTIVLYGLTASPQRAESALEAIEAAPTRFHTIGWILTESGSVGEVSSMGDCAHLLDAAGLMGRLRFNPGSAVLAARAESSIGHLASVASACPARGITISVRPVVAGDVDAEALAMARGLAIRDALESQAVDPAHVDVVVNADQDQLVIISPQHQGDR